MDDLCKLTFFDFSTLYKLMDTADELSRKKEFNEVEWAVDHTPRVRVSPFVFHKIFCKCFCFITVLLCLITTGSHSNCKWF